MSYVIDSHEWAQKGIPLPKLDRLLNTYVLLNLFLILSLAVEIVLLLLFFTFLAKSALLAFGLAFLFLTLFSFLILRLYYQTAKPEQLAEICQEFIDRNREQLGYSEETPQHPIALANACNRLADQLIGKENSYYQLPWQLPALQNLRQQFSSWWHWKDLLMLRELLLKASIEEHLKMVRCEPASLEIHAALANAYLRLANLYNSAKKSNGWMLQENTLQELTKKFHDACQRAIEEFKIISEYAPNDPWPYLQLAYCYRDLGQPHEEIAQFETFVKFAPSDKEALFTLGTLYFEQGLNAKGLRIYDALRQAQYKKSEQLIKLYGTS